MNKILKGLILFVIFVFFFGLLSNLTDTYTKSGTVINVNGSEIEVRYTNGKHEIVTPDVIFSKGDRIKVKMNTNMTDDPEDDYIMSCVNLDLVED